MRTAYAWSVGLLIPKLLHRAEEDTYLTLLDLLPSASMRRVSGYMHCARLQLWPIGATRRRTSYCVASPMIRGMIFCPRQTEDGRESQEFRVTRAVRR